VSFRRLLHQGFTLIEMIIVIVTLAIASVAVIGMVASVGDGASENSDLQVGAQLLQECGEWIVAQHRRDESFFTATFTSNSTCYGLTSYGGFGTPDVVVTTYAGAACPAGKECKQAAITITKDGAAMNAINLMLVKYN
jgi:prepilin-type N-terminal cleavage/methylation domain-containing protein